MASHQSSGSGRTNIAQGLSGVSGEFVASLGRKLADARVSLRALEADANCKSARDGLRRKLHAMGASAAMLRFDAMAIAVKQAEKSLGEGSSSPSPEVLVELSVTLDGLQALAWSSVPVSPIAPVVRQVMTERAATPAPASASAGSQVRENAAVAVASPSKPSHLSAPASQVADTRAASPNAQPSADAPAMLKSSDKCSEIASARLALPPITALVVGPYSVAESLAEETPRATRSLDVERLEHVDEAVAFTRALAPDVLVLDAAVKGAAGLARALAEDALTAAMPIVVVGSLDAAEAANFRALGVADVVCLPYSGEALRSVCEAVVAACEGRTARLSLGDPTLEQLSERLAAEVQRALAGAVDSASRSHRVSLGEGTDVMAAMWGAIARVREVVTARTGGAVRFAGHGPAGAALMTHWLDPQSAGSDRSRFRGRGAAADVELRGRSVVVADDDPAVRWFLADLLRASGCVVHEAVDGEAALAVAMQVCPDLVLSDILMPKLDGYALTRALKRDVVLRDTPVILLSWKEDLLQRVRELGAGATGYLRKQSDGRAVLARVQEAIWPRARVEARMQGHGEVSGRLDGLTVHTLLSLICARRPDARVSIRDASSLYEVEIRGGAPKRVSRTSIDAGYTHGPRALSALLGVGAGRFVITAASTTDVAGELCGTFAELTEAPVAAARGAVALASGLALKQRVRLRLDEASVASYGLALPEPARALLARLAAGTFVRDLIVYGAESPSLLEELLCDLGARGAIVGVLDEAGDDLLPRAVNLALGAQRGCVIAAPPSSRPSESSLPEMPADSARTLVVVPDATENETLYEADIVASTPVSIPINLTEMELEQVASDAEARPTITPPCPVALKVPMTPPPSPWQWALGLVAVVAVCAIVARVTSSSAPAELVSPLATVAEPALAPQTVAAAAASLPIGAQSLASTLTSTSTSTSTSTATRELSTPARVSSHSGQPSSARRAHDPRPGHPDASAQ